jgi:hypothetical protein
MKYATDVKYAQARIVFIQDAKVRGYPHLRLAHFLSYQD